MHENNGYGQDGRSLICGEIQQWAEALRGVEDRQRTTGALLVAGIDRLTLLNEAFGAKLVDEIIEKTGMRLRQHFNGRAVVERVNGDVFGIFIDRGMQDEIGKTAGALLNSFYEVPLQTSQGGVNIGVSIGGITLRAQDIDDGASPLTKAELALQEAKERGRGCFISYGEVVKKGANNKLMLEVASSFLKAMKDGRMRVAFQPVMDFRNETVVFHECLIRMVDAEGKIHAASTFMPIIEHLGLGHLADKFTFNCAFENLKLFSEINLSVNLSYATLGNGDRLREMLSVLRSSRDAASRLIVEITESMVASEPEKITAAAKMLKDAGCKVALDDFGAGFTAFTQIKDIELDMVKIDRSFIRNMKDKRNHLFVKTLQALADGINLKTVGEGVETMTEAAILAGEGISHVQGYVFGLPSVERIWLPKNHEHRHVKGGTA